MIHGGKGRSCSYVGWPLSDMAALHQRSGVVCKKYSHSQEEVLCNTPSWSSHRPARLLAMSWTDLNFDHAGGTKELLQRLASSPLVRQSLPNAAAICQQYFSFQRRPNENIQGFLVRESLGYTEFVEALTRLHEDKLGIKQEEKDFGLPNDDMEDDYEGGGSWDGVSPQSRRSPGCSLGKLCPQTNVKKR